MIRRLPSKAYIPILSIIYIISIISLYRLLTCELKLDFKDNMASLNTYEHSVCGACVRTINSAQKRVLIATFGFSDTHIARSLVLAHERGIKVKLYSGIKLNDFIKHYIGNSAEVFTIKIMSGGLYHQKILIADDWVCILSANFTDNSLHTDFNDCIFLKSKKIADALEEYLTNINEEHLSKQYEISDYIYVNNKYIFCKILMMPDNKENILKSLKTDVSRSNYIYGVFYVMSNKRWYNALLLYKKHRILVNKNPNNVNSKDVLSIHIKGKNLHSKLMFSEEFLMTGSMNFSQNAIGRNYESTIFIIPNIFYKKYLRYFNILKNL